MSEKRKRKRSFKDRRDAHFVKAPGLQTIMGYLWPKRTDCEVYMHTEIDATPLMSFLEKKNKSHPEYKTTLFHAAITAMARMLIERPLMNRFIQGYRMYERDEISISFVAKRRFTDQAEEALMVLKPKPKDTLDSISRKIWGDVREVRKSEHATGGIDEILDKLAGLPRILLIILIRIIRWLDFWGHNPKFLTEGDPNYATILCTNLGSIKAPAVYHHLNNYGTTSIFVSIGTWHKKEFINDDGTKELRTVVDLGAILDERIADGFYFARSLKLIEYIFLHPELLNRPIGKNSGYQYD